MIDFWASWCGPCRQLSPVVEQVAKENPDVKVCKVNVEEAESLAHDFKIMNIPTLVIMKNGQTINKLIGVVPKKEIITALHIL